MLAFAAVRGLSQLQAFAPRCQLQWLDPPVELPCAVAPVPVTAAVELLGLGPGGVLSEKPLFPPPCSNMCGKLWSDGTFKRADGVGWKCMVGFGLALGTVRCGTGTLTRGTGTLTRGTGTLMRGTGTLTRGISNASAEVIWAKVNAIKEMCVNRRPSKEASMTTLPLWRNPPQESRGSVGLLAQRSEFRM
jgi:hypothetical protein